MMSPEAMHPRDDFSPQGYRRILDRASALGYAITCFRDFTPPDERAPVLLLRHDLDHSIRSAVILAGIEVDAGVRSTYFVQTCCRFYNLLSPGSRDLIRRLVAMGHEIGLHYEAERYVGPDGPDHLRSDLALLRDVSGQEIISASQHIPIDSESIDVRQFVANEAYEPRFTEGVMTYISDSLMAWRQARPDDLLDRVQSFQLLTHPMKWSHPNGSLQEALDRARNDEVRALRQHYVEIGAKYRQLLRDRRHLDDAYRRRRSQMPPSSGPSATSSRDAPSADHRFLDRIQRVLDVVLVVATFPVWGAITAIAMLLIWLDSGRPLLFAQTRMGRDQQPFTILKIRTMIPGVAVPKEALFAGWTYADDPRITHVGHALRKYRIDELPQLLNVLKGDMSLVGPRPEPWDIAVSLGNEIPGYHERHTVRPGLSGLCQLSPQYRDFGTVEKSKAKARIDIEWIRSRSVGRLLWILLRTFGALVRGGGMA